MKESLLYKDNDRTHGIVTTKIGASM